MLNPPGTGISVIIPSYQSRETIPSCLRALARQELDVPYEVVIIDSSNDGTAEWIAEQYPAHRVVHLEGRTLPGAARNLGVEHAMGDLLVFLDADCVPEPEWLGKHVRSHRARPAAAAVGGSVTNGLRSNPVAWAGLLLEFTEYLPSAGARDVSLVPTCNASFKRRVFEAYGSFPTDVWPAEDQLFCWKLFQAREVLHFDPDIRIEHLFRPRLRAFLDHQERLGVASALARGRVDLPYHGLVRSPARFLVGILRFARLELRLLRQDRMNFLRFNVLLPWILPGILRWTLGFWRGCRQLASAGAGST